MGLFFKNPMIPHHLPPARGRGPITKNQVAALLRDYDIRPVVVHPTSSKELKDNNTAAVIMRLADLYDRLADRAEMRSNGGVPLGKT